MTVLSTERLVIAAGFVYLAVFGWSVANMSYDIWGVFILLPPLSLMSVLALRRMFRGDLHEVGKIMVIGLFVKFAGAAARYWVGFEAYGGGIDAGRYHRHAVGRATAVWSGEISVFEVIPAGTGTPFMENITAFVYTFTGASRLGGFMIFAVLAYFGTAWFVKAACVAVPGLMQRRYALLCVLAPSIVYWPSSIGKEAWMFLTLGLATYGIALLLARKGVLGPLMLAAAGFLGAGLMRPHIVVLFLVGAFPALLVLLFARRQEGQTADGALVHKIVVLGVLGIAAVSLSFVAGLTLRVLDFTDDEAVSSEAVTAIFDETTRRTIKSGSTFDPPSIESPVNWPYASVRTLTRPLLIEARGAGQLLSALEMTLLIGLALASGRRLLSVPQHVIKIPYVAFAPSVVFFGSLAYTSLANLGVLTRQRSLLFPLLLVLLCLPRIDRRAGMSTAIGHDATERPEQVAAAAMAGRDPWTVADEAPVRRNDVWAPRAAVPSGVWDLDPTPRSRAVAPPTWIPSRPLQRPSE